MAKSIGTGFGCVPATAASTVVGSRFISREIPAPSTGTVEIRTIIPTTIQQAGTTNPAFVAWYIVRGEKSADAVETDPASPLPGIPTGTDLKSLTLLAAGYMELRSQEPLSFGERELSAKSGEKLIVVITGIVDGSVIPPTLNQSFNAALTVLGIETGSSTIQNLKIR